MIGAVDSAATYVGYFVLGAFGLGILLIVGMRVTYESAVSDEAKEMAKEYDPNNSVAQSAAGVMFEMVIRESRDIGPEESIRAEPRPLAHFDWSTDDGDREEIETILRHLKQSGYYIHPFPRSRSYEDHEEWSEKTVGVWDTQPEWYVGEYDGRNFEAKEKLDVETPTEWHPVTEN